MTYIQSVHKHEHAMRACGSRCLSCSIFVRIKKTSSGQPCHLLAGLFHIFSLPVYHNTKHHLDSTIFPETTLYTENLFHLFQKLLCRKATPGRKATLKNHSLTSIVSVAETRAQTLPQVMRSKCLRPDVSGRSFINYAMDINNLENKINKLQFIEEVKEFRQIQPQSSLEHEMAEMPPVEKMSYLQSQMHFDESMESIADSDLEDGELQKLLTSPLHAQRASEKPDAMVVHERGECANVSFIRGSESFRETGCIVFTRM